MKSKGQTLVMFVIFIPLIIMFAALLVDVGLMYKEDTKLRSVTKDVIEDVIKNNSDVNALSIYEKNGIYSDKLIITINDKVNIVNEYDIDSIFGQIIGFDSYKVRVDMTGYYDNDELVFEE